ncbi:hypothetical protein [Serratia sp. BIGb0163]|uniref:hypothetical protein n=1 Tax=Serratia sp. BIGb0163 TaxID=2940613 RepID=UPI0021676420|nr:hypothetical protein [Serratia sp. BIGb0163]MCS4265019.1 hypothetical protein [Serratia sp. BIGb0163]
MKLFIANCSRQAHNFNYKLPEKSQSFGVTIRAGGQHVIENQSDVIHHIINQHEPYGFQRCDKVDNTFSGICYAIDKPVTVGRIEDNAEQKIENLDDMSQSILEANAISMSNAVDNAVLQSGQVPKPGEVQIEIVGEAVNVEQDNPPKLNKTVKVQK